MSESGIFNTAVNLAPNQRPAYLNQACDGNAACAGNRIAPSRHARRAACSTTGACGGD